jgi:hypothetical protein
VNKNQSTSAAFAGNAVQNIAANAARRINTARYGFVISRITFLIIYDPLKSVSPSDI